MKRSIGLGSRRGDLDEGKLADWRGEGFVKLR